MSIPPEVLSRLPEWKRVHGTVLYIPQTETSGYVFRAISISEWQEYQRIQALGNVDASDEELGRVLQRCLLWPEGFDLEELSQVDFVTLQQKVEEVSPFGSIPNFLQTLEHYREEHETISALVYAFLMLAFPRLSIEEIGQFTTRTLFTYLVLAEKILDRPFPLGDKKKPPSPIPAESVPQLNAQAGSERRQQAIARARAERAAAMAPTSGTPLSSITPTPSPSAKSAHG